MQISQIKSLKKKTMNSLGVLMQQEGATTKDVVTSSDPPVTDIHQVHGYQHHTGQAALQVLFLLHSNTLLEGLTFLIEQSCSHLLPFLLLLHNLI